MIAIRLVEFKREIRKLERRRMASSRWRDGDGRREWKALTHAGVLAYQLWGQVSAISQCIGG
jgi:hypothetical protein